MTLEEAIKSLPEKHQMVLDLYYNHQLSSKSIAARLGYSYSTVNIRRLWALFQLKKKFNPQEFEQIYRIMYGESRYTLSNLIDIHIAQ